MQTYLPEGDCKEPRKHRGHTADGGVSGSVCIGIETHGKPGAKGIAKHP
jgi:hypothetical protein